MAKTENDVLAEWISRGYITAQQADENEVKYLSFIGEARSGILARCNIPHNAPMPDGLLYAWADIAWEALRADETGPQSAGAVKSISEGDTTVTFATASEAAGAEAVGRSIAGHAAELNRFRRLPW